MAHEFLPQTVPAYAATQSFNKLRTLHPEYSYKEATLNPTNLRDRAVDWEADIIREFQANMKRPEISGIRETPTGKTLYLARPIHIKNAGCLTCHGVVSDAPETLLARYGKNNGFGWKMNEVVGAQIVTVPMSYPIQKAKEAFITFMASVAGVYLFVFRSLIASQLERNQEKLAEALSVLQVERDTWQKVCEKLGTRTATPHAGSPDAPVSTTSFDA